MTLTQEDIAATKALRQARVDEKRLVKDLNKVGKRISWCREKLELSQAQVCESTGIPRSSYCEREGGRRTEFIEEFLVLAVYFDREWQRKFNYTYPRFADQEIKKITADWLMFGDDHASKNAEALIQEFKIKMAELEYEHWQKEAELKRQLTLFSEGEI